MTPTTRPCTNKERLRRNLRHRCAPGRETHAPADRQDSRDNARLSRTYRGAPTRVLPDALVDRQFHFARAGHRGPRSSHDIQVVAIRPYQRDRGRGELAALSVASHTSSNNSLRDLARTIASLVALSAASMRASRSFCLRSSPLVGAIETLQRKRHVVSEPLQQFGEFGVNVSASAEMKTSRQRAGRRRTAERLRRPCASLKMNF